VSKRGRAQRRQTSLKKAYRNLFPDTNISIPAVTTMRRSLSMYVFFVNNTFFLIACFVNSSPEVTFRIVLVCCTSFHFYDLKTFKLPHYLPPKLKA
jgi:hypothetical protein